MELDNNFVGLSQYAFLDSFRNIMYLTSLCCVYCDLNRKKARTKGKNLMPSATSLVIKHGDHYHRSLTVIMPMYVCFGLRLLHVSSLVFMLNTFPFH